jgi:hypothetical protein
MRRGQHHGHAAKTSDIGCEVGIEPGPLLGDRLVHAPSQFLLDPPERCPHSAAGCAIPGHQGPDWQMTA